MERGVPIEEAINYTQRWGGFAASGKYGFTYIPFKSFYEGETGKPLPMGEYQSKNGKPQTYWSTLAALDRMHHVEVENERLKERLAQVERLLELKREGVDEDGVRMIDEMDNLCRAGVLKSCHT